MADSERLIAALLDPEYLSRLNAATWGDRDVADELREENDGAALPRAVDALVGLLASGGLGEVRERGAVFALGKLRHPFAVQALCKALSDPQRQRVHGHAAWALRQILDPRSVEPLIKALGEIHDPRSVDVDALVFLMTDSANSVGRSYVLSALEGNPAPRTADALFSYLDRQGNIEAVDAVLDVLAALGDARIIPMLMSHLSYGALSNGVLPNETSSHLERLGLRVLPELDRLAESSADERTKAAARLAAFRIRARYQGPPWKAVEWRDTGNVEIPYEATVGVERWQIRRNDGPIPGPRPWDPRGARVPQKHYSLLVEGQVVARFTDWPPAWKKPQGPS